MFSSKFLSLPFIKNVRIFAPLFGACRKKQLNQIGDAEIWNLLHKTYSSECTKVSQNWKVWVADSIQEILRCLYGSFVYMGCEGRK